MRLTCVLAACIVSASAYGSVQFFFDTTNPWVGGGPSGQGGGPLDPTGDNNLDYTQDGYVINYWPPAFIPTLLVPVPPPDPIYIWLKFHNEPNSRKIIGIHLEQAGDNPGDIAYYIQDDMNGLGYKRWDGTYTPPTDPEFKKLDQKLVAVTAQGIRNKQSDVLWNMYKGGAYRTALLGAIRVDTPGTYKLKLGSLGIAYVTGSPTAEFGELIVLPEPGSLLLLCLATSFRRRG